MTEDMSKMLCVLDGNLLRCACRSIARQVGHCRQVSKSPHTHRHTHTHTSRLPSAVIRCSGRVCLGPGLFGNTIKLVEKSLLGQIEVCHVPQQFSESTLRESYLRQLEAASAQCPTRAACPGNNRA